MYEVRMSISKLDISEKLIEGYVKAPPSLKDQAITTLAIQLCQNFELKKYILCESEKLRRNKYSILNSMWEILIQKQSTDMCEKLPLPPALQNLLIVSIRSIAVQLFNWNRQQEMFNFPPLFADSFLTPFDWTVEMRLDEKKIAERLVQDEKIPVVQRYKMACMYCLELFILSLWSQMSPKQRTDMYFYKDPGTVKQWSIQLTVAIYRMVEYDFAFWIILMGHGIHEGSRLTVLHCWDKSNENFRQHVIRFAKRVVSKIHKLKLREKITGDFLLYRRLSSLEPDIDILCFLLKQMSEEQRVKFFQEALQDTGHNVLVCFLQWPYLDLLIPIIEGLWNILPESKYGDLLLSLANHYSIENGDNAGRNDYMDYYYGDLIVALLEKTPNHFKRYVFSDNYLPDRKTIKAGELLFILINKKPLKIRNIKIFQNILQHHVTFEEKLSFLRSKYGASFCCHLALEENWELLNSMLRECLPENEIPRFKMEVLVSKSGKESCFQMLSEVNDDRFNSWLNWGFSSEQEIFQFIFNIFFKDHRLDFKKASSFQYIIEINCFEKVIRRYAPSDDTVRNFKSRFVKIYSTDVCINCVKHSKWPEVDRFLTWGFPSEDNRMQFKKWFVKIYAMDLCEYHIAHSNLQNVDKFLTWCFPTVKAIEQFKQELFLSSGLNFPWVQLSRNLQDLDILIQWFELDPEALEEFKWKVLICPKTLSTIFDSLPLLAKYLLDDHIFFEDMFQRDTKFLRWGLNNRERVITFLDVSNNYLRSLSFAHWNIRRWVHAWSEWIKEIDCDLIRKASVSLQPLDSSIFAVKKYLNG